jgi:methylase of polypeptide subunit release factors
VKRGLTSMSNESEQMSAAALSGLLQHLHCEAYRFVTPTPATHQRVNGRALNRASRSLTDVFGWSRPFARSLLPAALFGSLAEGGIIFECSEGWRSQVRVSALGGNLFLHSAFPTFGTDAVFFGPDTYRFARAVRGHLLVTRGPIRRALDIGCGCGAGGATIAKNMSCGEVVMTDINDTALHLSQVNIQSAGLNNVRTVRSDLFDNVDGEFDLIIANPPYLNDPLARTYRHGGGELGSALSLQIAEQALSRLSAGGSLLLYTGAPIVDGVDAFHHAVGQILSQTTLKWSYEEIDPDVFGEELQAAAYGRVDRIAVVILSAQKSGALLC